MAAPIIETLPSFEPLALDEHISRWITSPSSPSFSCSTSSSSSASGSSFTDADCPSMFKSSTGSESLSSDTQTENETPPESPREDLEATPVVVARPFDYPSRPAFFSRVSIYSDLDDAGGPDAGYETECEDKQMRGPFVKRAALRRIPADRRRGEHQHRPGPDRLPTHAPSVCPPKLSPPDMRPQKIDIPPPSIPSESASKAPIGLGLGLGLRFPSTLSAVRRAPNCMHRSNTDPPPPMTFSEVVTPFSHIRICTKHRLRALPSPSTEDSISPLELPSLACLASQLRHPAFSFAHSSSGHLGSTTTAAAILTFATMSQSRFPPSRSSFSQLQSTPEDELLEVCEGDAARGIRRFASKSLNPYFPTMGYRVISG